MEIKKFKKINLLTYTLFIIFVFLIFFFVNYACSLYTKKILVKGNLVYTSAQDIEDKLESFQPIKFFRINLIKMRNSLLQLPWIADVKLQRSWPLTLDLIFEEKVPIALWGEKGVVSTEGGLFFPDNLSVKNLSIPKFIGSDEQLEEILSAYYLLIKNLSLLNLSVKELKNVPDLGWQAMLSNEVKLILGNGELDSKLKRFKFAFRSDLEKKVGQIAYVDLRYTNSIAIGWKSVGVITY